MNPDAFDALVTNVRGDRLPRVWSLLVTVFGDLAQGDCAAIGSAPLNGIASLIGIRPEAVRVALHRLRKDGWIVSRRTGRRSAYALTPWGRTQSAGASPVIYARDPVESDAWLVLTDPSQPAQEAGQDLFPIASGVALAAAPAREAGELSLRLDCATPVPPWIAEKVCAPETVCQSRILATRLERLCLELVSTDCLSPLQIAVLRVVIVHEWRRIVLKVPRLPDHVFPDGWAGPDCRRHVSDLLSRLPKPRLDALDAVEAGQP